MTSYNWSSVKLTGSVGQTQAAITSEWSYKKELELEKWHEQSYDFGTYVVDWWNQPPDKQTTDEPHKDHDRK